MRTRRTRFDADKNQHTTSMRAKSTFRKLYLFTLLLVVCTNLTSCESNWEDPEGADILIYFEDVSDNEKRALEALASSHADSIEPMSTTESSISNRFTIRMWFGDPKEFKDSGRLDNMKRAMEAIKKPSSFKQLR